MLKRFGSVGIGTVLENIIVPLSVGCILYVVTRPDSYISRIASEILNIRIGNGLLAPTNVPIWTKVIRNHAADFLWAYAFAFAIMLVGRKTGINEPKLIILCCIVSVLIEISQVFSPFFTFDFVDILVEVIGIIVGWFVYRWHNHIKEKREISS